MTPGIYGFVGATKWLTRLTLTTYAEESAYWTDRDWATDAPIKISSRVDTPKPLSTIDAGRTVIGGIAWAQHRGIGKVEVRIDDGEWQQAELGPEVTVDYWRQWYLPWDAPSGRHDIAVRATSGGRRGAGRRPRDAVPGRLQRHPAGRRPRVLNKPSTNFARNPIRSTRSTEPLRV